MTHPHELRKLAEKARWTWANDGSDEGPNGSLKQNAYDELASQHQAILALLDQNEAMRKALEPFKNVGEAIQSPDDIDEDLGAIIELTHKQCRALRNAAKTTGET